MIAHEEDNNEYLPLVNVSNNIQSINNSPLKWFQRRLKKIIIMQSWPNFLTISFLITIAFFILSTYFYMLIQTSSNKLEKINHFNKLLKRNDSNVAYQINDYLKQIEISIEENRKILNSIQNSDTFVNVFQRKINENICQNFSLLTSLNNVNIHMENVYNNLLFDNPDGGVWKQGWPLVINEHFQITKPKLKVFIVPHSHNDPGWIKTFDFYFQKQTSHILTNAVNYLSKHSDMKFIWAETSYLSAWWETTNDLNRDLFKNLINNGQLEIVTGGWVMNDEANSHYSSILTQLIEGHEWLENTIGVRPKNGWAIDPFGLSPTMAYFFKLMGFKGMVVQRVHYSIKKYLAQNKYLEIRWRQHWETSVTQDILCHIEPFYSYDIPHTCGPDPKICCQFDFKRLPPKPKPKCPWKVNPQMITDDNIEER